MDKDVIISISGEQTSDTAERENVELITAGTLGRFGGGYRLSYLESELAGLAGTKTTFQVEPDRITLLRAGSVNSQMIFERGRKHLSLYETDYGSLTVGVSAQRVESRLDDSGGEIDINYTIEIDHELAGENRFHISVKEARRFMPQ